MNDILSMLYALMMWLFVIVGLVVSVRWTKKQFGNLAQTLALFTIIFLTLFGDLFHMNW